jgi:eukaryotic-like serine/threonine-protein kinase
MTLSAGSRLGPYDIVAPLGAGGMGEVYRATDTRLKRQVAVKILPTALAADPDRLARFQREAEVLASLNHPRIATIYGLEDTADGKALVMELIEGSTLADRIAQGRVPLDEALPIARQIADALEAAHAQGIIHRDLKPANIKVRENGTVKVLDFGLAKLTEAGGSRRPGQDDSSQSPTLTSPAAMTAMGMIVGTAAYMSPEQARGRTVDKRTDVWAFGAVLYEMLSGARAFTGSSDAGESGGAAETSSDLIAAVLTSTPDWTALPADLPPSVLTLIQRCLEKDRSARIGDIAVARFLLDGQATSGATPSQPHAAARDVAPRWRQILPWVLGAVAAGVLAGTSIGWFLLRRPAPASHVTHLQMSVAPADQLVGSIASVRPSRTAIALSPDGRTVAFAATRGTVTQLYVRGLDRAEGTPIAGTEGASSPFFSPDGTWIGFRAANTIKKVATGGGAPVTIADAEAGNASWGDDNIIYFAAPDGISSVPSTGGTVATVTTRDASKRERHILPHAVPGGKAVLFTLVTSGWDTANIVLHRLDTGERRVLVQGGADARVVGTGHIVYLKSGTLMAVPFDVRALQVTGAPVVLLEGVMQAVNAPNSADETGAGQFAVSSSGTLLYVTGGVGRALETSWVWVDRTGAAQPLNVPAGPYLFPRLSPDGQKVAVTVRASSPDVWVYDVLRGAPTRLTVEGGSHPIWSPDGKRMVLTVRAEGVSNLAVLSPDGGGKPERLAPSAYAQIPTSWSTTNVLAFLQRPQLGSTAIWVLPMDGDQRKPVLFLESRFTLSHAEFSPDGRWIAYVSYESGAPDVYVQPYPGPGEKIRISTAGGTEPIWAANGHELLYRHEGQFFSAAIRSLSPFRIDTPRVLFATKGEYDSTSPLRSWNVSADGQRFLLSRYTESRDKPVTAIHVVLNWTEELKRLVAAK